MSGVTLADILISFRGDRTHVDRTQADLTRDLRRFGEQEVRIHIGLDVTGLQAGMQRAEATVRGGAGRLQGILAGALSYVVGGAITAGLQAVTNGVMGLANGMIGGNAAFEDYQVRFTTLLKSTELAKQRMSELATFAANTPFELPNVVQADIVLQGFGFHSAEAAKKFGFSGEQIRTIAGDLAAGTGRNFEEMAGLLGRFSTGSVGEALSRFAELGAVTRDQLAAMGVQFSKSGELISDKNKAMTALLTILQGKYGGLMEAQAMTFGGMLSNLQDWMGNAARVVGAPLFEGLRQSLGMLLLALNSPEAQAGVQALAQGMTGLVAAVGRVVQAVVPVVAFVAGVFVPLVKLGAEWGSGFIEAFASGISAAISFVADALGGLASMVTNLLMPHSPPKILPDLDKWGTKAAEVWMGGWKEADFSLFESIGKGINQALANAVGMGQVQEADQIPMLAQAKAALAELMSKRSGGGTFDETLLLKLKAAAGPAGQSVYELADSYLKLDWAGRQVAQAQEDLNTVTDRYSAILDPLNAQLTGVRRQMGLLRDQQRLTEINKKLATATGDDKKLLLLERQELGLNRQISIQEQARAAEVKAGEEKVKAAQKQEATFKQELADLQAKQQLETESVNAAKQQVDLLTKLAKEAANAGGAMGGIAKSQNEVNAAVQEARAKAAALQKQYEDLKAKITAPFEAGQQAIAPYITALRAVISTVQTGTYTGGIFGLTEGSPVIRGLVLFGATARNVRDALTFLVTGNMSQNLFETFGPGSPVNLGLGAMRTRIVQFGADALRVFASVRDAVLFLATGNMSQGLLDTFGAGSPVLLGLLALRYHLVTFGTTARSVFASVRDALAFLMTGNMSQGLLNTFGAGSPVLLGLLALRYEFVMLGALVGRIGVVLRQAFGGIGSVMKSFVTDLLANGPVAAISGLGTRLKAALPLLLVAGKELAWGFVTALIGTIPEGIRTRITSIGAPIIAAFAGVFAGMTLGPVVAGLFANVGAVLTTVFGAFGTLIGWLTPLLGGLGTAFLALLTPLGGLLSNVGLSVAILLSQLPSFGAMFLWLQGVFGTIGVAIALVLTRIPSLSAMLMALRSAFTTVGVAIALVLTRIPSFGAIILWLRTAFSTLGMTLAILMSRIPSFGAMFLWLRGIFGTIGLSLAILMSRLPSLGSMFASLRSIFTTVGGGLMGVIMRLGPMLSKSGMAFWKIGKTILSLVTPFGIIMTLVDAFVGAWLSNFGGIRETTATALGPVVPILQQLGQAFTTVFSLLMQGNWQGALGALKGTFANLGTIFAPLAASLQTGIPAIFAILMAYLGQMATQIIGWIGAALPPIITTLGQWALAFLDWIVPMIPPMLEALGGLLATILTAVGNALPGIVAALSGFIAAFVAWVLVAGPPLLRELGSLIVKLLAWCAEQIPGIANQLGIWALQFLSWVTDVIPKLILELGKLFGAFLQWVLDSAPGILEKLGEWSKAFTDWVTTKALPALLDSLGKMWDGLWTELQKLWNNAFAKGTLGESIVNGIKSGISTAWVDFSKWFVSMLVNLPGGQQVVDFLSGMMPKPNPPPTGDSRGDTSAPPPDAAAQAAAQAALTAAQTKADASNAKVVTAKANLITANAAYAASPTKANQEAAAAALGLLKYAEIIAKADRAAAEAAAKAVKRASGGPVKRGGFYLVGEQGPEYFQPGADGAIHPNSVYQAIQQPFGNLGALISQRGATQTLPRLPGSSGVSVSLTVNNPVFDSDARMEQFKREITAMLTASINRTLAAEG